jgi:hypothetical protein
LISAYWLTIGLCDGGKSEILSQDILWDSLYHYKSVSPDSPARHLPITVS